MASKQYGTTAWGAWFLKMLSRYDGSGRLSRGKTYANTGKVTSLHVDGQRVVAKVSGHFDPFYTVTIGFPKIDDETKTKINAILQNDVTSRLSLQQGILSSALIEQFENENVSLIPNEWKRLYRTCSCPDDGDPCKHMAATLFILAREIDFDAKLLFQIAGYEIENVNANVNINANKKKCLNKNENENERACENANKTSSEKQKCLPKIFEPISLSLQNKKIENRITKNCVLDFSIEENYIELITHLLPQHSIFSKNEFTPKLASLYHYAISHSYEFPNDEPNFSNIFFANISIDESDEKKLQNSKNKFSIFNVTRLNVKIEFTENEKMKMSLLDAEKLFLQKNIRLHSAEQLENFSHSFIVAYNFFALAQKLIYSSAFIPSVCVNEKNTRLKIIWKALSSASDIALAIENFSKLLDEKFFPLVKKFGALYCAELLLASYLTEFVHRLHFVPESSAIDFTIDSLFFAPREINLQKPGNANLPNVLFTFFSVLHYENETYNYRLVLKESAKKTSKTLQLSFEFAEKKSANKKFLKLSRASKNESENVLRFPLMLSYFLPAILKLTNQDFLHLDLNDVADFLQNAVGVLRKFGVTVLLPKSLEKELKMKTVISLRTKNSSSKKIVKSFLNFGDIFSYDLQVMLGNETVSIEEFKKLVSKKTKLVKFKNQFVLLNPDEAEKLLSHFEKKLSRFDVLQNVLDETIVADEKTKLCFENFFHVNELKPPKNLNAHLRPYQLLGFSWMYANIKNGFGCLLADDMGLGKTIQVLSLLLFLKQTNELHDKTNGALIVCPASLLSNWKHECALFSPTLSCEEYHGAKRKLKNADIILTTYQTLQIDSEKLKKEKFAFVILDEAQAIKNAETKNAKAVKNLKSNFRLALTGTPIENNLEDLRSIFDFILPTFLGDEKSFREKFRIPIELHGDKNVSRSLNKITAPFILRRLKTDKKIISDLPEKIVANEYCNLTKVQASLYDALVQSELQQVFNADSKIKRSARIFKLLTSLKQICNHPKAYDENESEDANLSGKMMRLLEIAKQSLESGEKILIFSQYVETLNLLQNAIEKNLRAECLQITGKQNLKTRTENVERFQTNVHNRILLVSLKAGGTGLNLTKANHVIHYDLWFNPAVEDQATDRAFRIGQTQNVFVTRLISEGTFEEQIDKMIFQKRNLAGTLQAGETWISKLSNDELKEIVNLRK